MDVLQVKFENDVKAEGTKPNPQAANSGKKFENDVKAEGTKHFKKI